MKHVDFFQSLVASEHFADRRESTAPGGERGEWGGGGVWGG